MKRLILSCLSLLSLGLAALGPQFGRTLLNDKEPATVVVPVPDANCPQIFLEARQIALAEDAPDGKARLEISITDRMTGKPTPARIEVRGEDGRYHVADNPLPTGYFVFYKFDAGESRTPFKERFSRGGQGPSIRNHFADSTEFYTTGECRITLAPGRYRVRVTKGPEFRRATETVRVESGKQQALVVQLER